MSAMRMRRLDGRSRAGIAAVTVLLASGLLGLAAPHAFAADGVDVASVSAAITLLPTDITALDREAVADTWKAYLALDATEAALLPAPAVERLQQAIARLETELPASDGTVILADAPFSVDVTTVPLDPGTVPTALAGRQVLDYLEINALDLLTGELWEPELGTTAKVYLVDWRPTLDPARLSVALVNDDGTLAMLPLLQDEKGWFFETPHFSQFAIIAAAAELAGSATLPNVSGADLPNNIPAGNGAVLPNSLYTVTSGTEIITAINNLPATITAANIAQVVEVTKSLEALTTSDPAQAAVVKADAAYQRLVTAQSQAHAINKKTADATLENAPWYVQMVSKPIGPQENAYLNVQNALPNRVVLGLWDFAPVDWMNVVNGVAQPWGTPTIPTTLPATVPSSNTGTTVTPDGSASRPFSLGKPVRTDDQDWVYTVYAPTDSRSSAAPAGYRYLTGTISFLNKSGYDASPGTDFTLGFVPDGGSVYTEDTASCDDYDYTDYRNLTVPANITTATQAKYCVAVPVSASTIGSVTVEYEYDATPIAYFRETGPNNTQPTGGTGAVRVYLDNLQVGSAYTDLKVASLESDGTLKELPLTQEGTRWYFQPTHFSRYAVHAAATAATPSTLPATVPTGVLPEITPPGEPAGNVGLTHTGTTVLGLLAGAALLAGGGTLLFRSRRKNQY